MIARGTGAAGLVGWGIGSVVAGLFVAAVAASATTSCTIITSTSADQCKSNADCTGALAGGVCQNGICVTQSTACTKDSECASGHCDVANKKCVTPSGCQTNQECLTMMGDYHICRKVNGNGTCVALVSTECTTIYGDYKDDNAVIFGSILPTSGPDESTGKPLENAIELAINDFKQTSNGLPPAPGQSAHRPIALIGCSDNSDSDTAAKAAKHLAEDVGVPAIIGAAFSGISIKVATAVTIPDKVLLFSPSATSVALTDLADNGLVWRSSPSDVFQAQAISLLVPQIEATVRQELSLMASDKISVAILHKGDAYGAGLGKALEKTLVFNGKPALDMSNAPYYFRADFGDPDDPMNDPPKYAQVVTQTIGKAPHIILDFGTNESITNIALPIEAQWTNGMYKAHFVFADGGLVNDLWDGVGTNDDLRKRIIGSVPGTTNALFAYFKSQYSTQFNDGTSPDVFGAAGAYDILYLLAYGTVALGSMPVNGTNLAAAMAKMVPPGKPVDVGSDAINSTFPILSSGQNIDFNGASGPLDFDIKTGEAPSDIQFWCMPKDGMGKATSGVASGLFYNAKTGKVEGAIGALCN